MKKDVDVRAGSSLDEETRVRKGGKLCYSLSSTEHVSRVTEAAFHADLGADVRLRTTGGGTRRAAQLVLAVGWTRNSWRHNSKSLGDRKTAATPTR